MKIPILGDTAAPKINVKPISAWNKMPQATKLMKLFIRLTGFRYNHHLRTIFLGCKKNEYQVNNNNVAA